MLSMTVIVEYYSPFKPYSDDGDNKFSLHYGSRPVCAVHVCTVVRLNSDTSRKGDCGCFHIRLFVYCFYFILLPVCFASSAKAGRHIRGKFSVVHLPNHLSVALYIHLSHLVSACISMWQMCSLKHSCSGMVKFFCNRETA